MGNGERGTGNGEWGMGNGEFCSGDDNKIQTGAGVGVWGVGCGGNIDLSGTIVLLFAGSKPDVGVALPRHSSRLFPTP